MLEVDELVDVANPLETNERARSPSETFMAIQGHKYEKNAERLGF